MKASRVLPAFVAFAAVCASAMAAPKTLLARRIEPRPAGAEVEHVYFMPDHGKSQRVFVKVRAKNPEGRTVYWHNVLPRAVFYDRTDYKIYYEGDDLRLYTLAESIENHPFAPPGILFRHQPGVTLALEPDRAVVRFDDEEVAPGPPVPGQGGKIPFP